MDSLPEEFFMRDPTVEEQTKGEIKNKVEKSTDQLDKQEKDIPTDLVPVNLLLEVKKLLNAINTLPKGVVPHIKKFLQENFSFQIMQREVAANSQNVEEIVPVLTLRFLITQLEAALRNIQATNYTAHQINIGYYLTLLFLYGVALTERGKKEDYTEAENKFLVMKMVIQENEICENFMSLVYFGRGLLRCAQKRYNGGLLEFHKSLQEIGETNDHWFDIDPTEDEDLPTTFKDLLNDFIKTTESNIMKQTICSYLDCERSCEADILKNTNYKGFFQLMCSKSCCVYFHKICWKKFKNLKYPGENDQTFSGKKCLKEGCTGDMVRMLQCDVPGIVKILFEVVRKDEYITIENLGASYKKLMSLKITDTDIRPKISLKFSTKDEMPIFKLDYNYFYHLLHIIIISGTDIVRQIFDEAMPPPLLKKELLIHKNVLEPYYNHLWTNHPLGGAWHLLYPPNKELPQSKQFDLYLLLALIKHLNVFPAPKKGWNMEPSSSDLSKSADILRLCKYRDILLSEILMNGLTESQFNSIWKKVSDILLRLGMKQEDIEKVKENPIENISLDYHQLSIYLGIPVPEIIQRMLSCYQQGIALQSITGSQRIELEELQNEEEELSPPLMEYNINVKSNPEIQLAEMSKDGASIPSESSTESIKDLQEVKSKPKKKKKTKNKKNKESKEEQVPNMIEKEEQLKKEQANLYPVSGFMKDDASDIQEDSATEDKFYSLDELHILDMIEQGSTSKAEYGETEKEKLARQRQLYKLHYQCEDFKRQLKTVTFRWQENQMQIKKKDKIIASLNQQVAFGINKVSKLQRQSHAKDNEIKNLKDQLSMKRSQWEMEKHNLESTIKTYLNKLNAETSRALTAEVYFLQCRRDFGLLHLEQTEKECLSQLARVTHMAASNLESLQLKAAVESWNAIVTDVRNKIAFLRTQYNEQINKVKQGFALSTLPPIQLPPPPPSPEILMQQFLGRPLVKESFFRPILTVPQMPAVCPGVISAPGQPRAPLMTGIAWTVPTPVGEAVSPSAGLGSDPPMMNWERITDRLKTAFPQQTRKELTDFLRKLKDIHGKSLSGLTFDEIVYKISQFIDPKRSQSQGKSMPNGNCVSPSHTPPQSNAAQPPKPAWRPLSSQGPASWEGANNLDDDDDEEEPCVICHENLSPENLSVLPCAHKFHSQCIRPWLMQQGTCPTCRLHVLLPEEFPGHLSRHLPKI
ncbi:E3 ubiquitin-protein ligase DZIP3 isoform X2 [Canis lupus baileyi]|uniref:E3 ubiquitin-protein ligase DZIP3 isoform X2 n=1 Tax=Canis lupus familiaris TaxID=9615 RepID=UPI00005A55A0|nr:E3 ubiquitin-protein ligase DZIP3 isoform X2 [Canis lupus familiaris]XP_025334032.1 E3 ubiquitin-protein ligase DZIP3 isoform X2 [Canis lupus dingo]XP_038318473.1 E3 ubiquitin-protein ligase DZIP3 isoform X2 [Canis lupus familiaris]XP_038318474.1 E3 ubiquitin-protein ligase DZIP3 isoform X2 [Canis lupus familiaris]XP_048961487.1 E3 ubiquitin-protein ligase DZIP3 isoform X2 [Canis lupus dingo]XP_048961488.1 E3 ubiquitin-protein ligase DZIP3 isoform X2 [Canis lupus dingo]XP_535732.2 E3 ubiqu|eukprot:XP_022269545.1 E3 ubiquitin-protein ligase DZIP3 isoform X2 [Canis lupus familiaris]